MTIEEYRQELKQDLEIKKQTMIGAIKHRHEDRIKALKSIMQYKKSIGYYHMALLQTTTDVI